MSSKQNFVLIRLKLISALTNVAKFNRSIQFNFSVTFDFTLLPKFYTFILQENS